VDGCGYRDDNVESIVAGVLLLLSPVAVLSMVRRRGRDGCMSPEVAALVPGDVAIFVVAIVCQNADINMSGLGVNHSGAIGDCAIVGGCASGNSDCDGDVLWLCWRQWGEAAEQVSYCKGGSGECLVPHTSEYDVIVFLCTVGNV